jgi:hypothetical protein
MRIIGLPKTDDLSIERCPSLTGVFVIFQNAYSCPFSQY